MANRTWTDAQAGPASYPTGGVVIATSLSTVDAFDVEIQTPGALLGQVQFDISVSGATATVKVMRLNHDKLTAIGNMSGLDASVSATAASGATVNNETAHTHDLTHNHSVTAASSGPSTGTDPSTATVGGSNLSAHTHTADLPSAAVTSGTASHNHVDNNIYQHQHSLTNTQTDVAATEIANGTDLSGVTFLFVAEEN